MKPPAHATTYESELGTYWMDEEGILVSISKNPTRTIENVKRNMEVVKQVTGGKKVCHLVYISPSGKPDKKTREFVSRELPNLYKAMAMVSSSGLGNIIMRVLFKLLPPTIPMRSFTSETEAREWLKKYR